MQANHLVEWAARLHIRLTDYNTDDNSERKRQFRLLTGPDGKERKESIDLALKHLRHNRTERAIGVI